jgi:hypothetical protein
VGHPERPEQHVAVGQREPEVILAEPQQDGIVDDPTSHLARSRATSMFVNAKASGPLDRLPPGAAEGDFDERWYWAAPLMLDTDADRWAHRDLAAEWTGWDKRASAQESRWQEHVELARSAVDGSLDPALGRRPEDLPEVLARLAVGGPGTLALRALTRVTDLPADSLVARLAAARVAWALRGLFNAPEATAPLRAGRASREDSYWREVMRHCIERAIGWLDLAWRNAEATTLDLRARAARSGFEVLFDEGSTKELRGQLSALLDDHDARRTH